MPSEHKIPARTVRECEPCPHHKLIAALHVRCDEGGYREYACMHDEAHDDLFKDLPSDPVKAAKIGELRARWKGEGRHIGRTEEQPDWCPLRRKA